MGVAGKSTAPRPFLLRRGIRLRRRRQVARGRSPSRKAAARGRATQPPTITDGTPAISDTHPSFRHGDLDLEEAVALTLFVPAGFIVQALASEHRVATLLPKIRTIANYRRTVNHGESGDA